MECDVLKDTKDLRKEGPSRQTKKAVYLISWISFFWSASSLMVFSILPIYLSENLKVNHATIGLIEGVAVFASFITKIFSGVLCDYFRNRKFFITFGSLLSILSKILFPIALTPLFVFFARFLDRMSKGIRSAPADAYIGDICKDQREFSYAYGVRQGLYTLGAAFGALLAMFILYRTQDNFSLVFLFAVLPTIISFLLCFRLPEPIFIKRVKQEQSLKKQLRDVKKLPSRFWQLMFLCSVFMTARFGEAFVTLRAKELACPLQLIPLATIVMDLIHASCAFFIGKITAKKLKETKALQLGILLFIFTHFIFMRADNLSMMVLGIILLGVHMGMTQGVLRSMIAEATDPSIRGTAFSVFYLVCATSLLVGNTLAGFLSDFFGLYSAFAAGMVLSALALMISLVVSGHEISVEKKSNHILR